MRTFVSPARVAIVASVFAFAGCASSVSENSLQRPADTTPVVLAHDFLYDISDDTDLPRPEAGSVRGLLAGTYVPEYEDAGGTYYRGIGACVVTGTSPLKHRNRYLAQGGIWIAKSRGAEPSFRLYQVPLTAKVLPLEPAADSASPCTREFMTPAPEFDHEKTARFGIVVQAMIESDHGKLVFLPNPNAKAGLDTAFASLYR